MKILSFRIKHGWIRWFFLVVASPVLYAQTDLVNEYLREVGGYAHLYSGELETIYNTFLYKNDPYYKSSQYADGELIYRGNYYPNQKLRLDLYKDQLTLLTPELRLGVIINPAHLNEAKIHNQTIIYHIPPKESGLKPGFYIFLYKGTSSQLLSRFTTKVEEVLRDEVIQEFSLIQRYYLLKDGIYHPVRNRKSFMKLFPVHKKDIKKFAKENERLLSSDKEEGLIRLAEFCEEINQRTRL